MNFKRVILFASVLAICASPTFAQDVNFEGGILQMVVDGGGTPLGTLNLTDNNAIVHAVQTSTASTGPWTDGDYSTMHYFLQTGYNGGSWDGAGIQSDDWTDPEPPYTVYTFPDPYHGIGLATGEEYAAIGYGDFHGVSFTDTDYLCNYSWTGDVDMDGELSFWDFAHMDDVWNNEGAGGDRFVNGDIDYDGELSFWDFAAADDCWNYLNPASGGNLTPIPEPSTLVLLSMLAASLFTFKFFKK